MTSSIGMGEGTNESGKGLLKSGRLEGLLKDIELPSIAKELVHPGKDPQELLMRTFFRTDKELNAVVNYLSKCREFDDKEGEQVLLMKLAGKTSIDGLARSQLVEVLTGQLRRAVPEPETKEKKDKKGGL